jgi:hypothetical protein
MWFYASTLPVGDSCCSLLSSESSMVSPAMVVPVKSRIHFELSLLSNGRLKMFSNAASDQDGIFRASSHSKVRRGHWVHLALIWYPKMGGHPNLRK